MCGPEPRIDSAPGAASAIPDPRGFRAHPGPWLIAVTPADYSAWEPRDHAADARPPIAV